MPKLKPEWVKTDIPKDAKLKLWRIMRDNPTFDAFQGQVSKRYDEIFGGVSKTQDKYGTISRDTYKALQYETKHMPVEEVASLPADLQSWVKQLRPELELEIKRVPGTIPEGLLGLAVQLHDSLPRIGARDQVVWQLPDATWPSFSPLVSTDESPAELRIWLDKGTLKVDLLLEKDERFLLLMMRLEAMSPEFKKFQEFKQWLAVVLGECQGICREIWHEAERETGMKMVGFSLGRREGLYNVPEFIYEFALKNYGDKVSPQLVVLPHNTGCYKLTRVGATEYILAIGSEKEMTKCQEATTSLCKQYARDERIGQMRGKEVKMRKRTELFQKALSDILFS